MTVESGSTTLVYLGVRYSAFVGIVCGSTRAARGEAVVPPGLRRG